MDVTGTSSPRSAERPTSRPAGVPTAPVGDLADHLAAIRRHWLVVACSTLLGLILAAVVTIVLPHRYEATTAVLVLPTGVQDVNATGGRTQETINLDTEAQLVRSTAVAQRARALLSTTTPATELAEAVEVSVPPNSTVLDIAYSAPDPAAARAGSHAFARAYLGNRADSARSATNANVRALRDRADRVARQLRGTTKKLANAAPNSSTHAMLDAQRRNLTDQLGALGKQIDEATTNAAGPGRIITAAAAPSQPTSPSVPVDLAGGLVLGLLVGVAVALGVGRYGRRVRTAGDLARRTGAPVLAQVTAAGSAHAFGRLRNELAALEGGPTVLAVVGVGCSGAAVAEPLATAFGRTGLDTVLVAAAGDRPHPAVPDRPGLADVLAGAVDLADALHPLTAAPATTTAPATPAPRTRPAPPDEAAPSASPDEAASPEEPALPDEAAPSALPALSVPPAEPALSVLPAGNPVGTLSVPALDTVLDLLRRDREMVLLTAPDTAGGPEAQALAAHADAAILAVARRVASHAEVRDAIEQLRRVGTPLLGAVLVPAPAAPSGPASDDAGRVAPGPTGAAGEPTEDDVPRRDEAPVGTGTRA